MRLRLKLGLSEEAMSIFLEAGFILFSAGRLDEALDIFTGCIELLPESEIPLIGIARCYMATGNTYRAMLWTERAINSRHRSQFAAFTLAEIYLIHGEREKAQHILEAFTDSALKKPFVIWRQKLLTMLNKTKNRHG